MRLGLPFKPKGLERALGKLARPGAAQTLMAARAVFDSHSQRYIRPLPPPNHPLLYFILLLFLFTFTSDYTLPSCPVPLAVTTV